VVDTDPLTHVLNRRGIEAAHGLELRRGSRSGDSLIAVLIDCDDFKSINDSFGHGVGDVALTALARSVQDTVRAGDYVGRVGGDEFLVLLPSTTVAEGMVVAV
jgi:diguanylate cyclase (GGDEF)-like protein